MKSFLIAAAFVGILGALATAGVRMLRSGRDEDEKGKGMMNALALRVALSIALFLAILGAYALGWIQPSGLPLGR